MILERLLIWFFSLPVIESMKFSLSSSVRGAFQSLLNFIGFIDPVFDCNTFIVSIALIASTWAFVVFLKLMIKLIGVIKP